MFSLFARSNAARSESKPVGRCLLIAAAAVIGPAAVAAGAGTQLELDNPGDPNFNQLLGINDAGVIVGYFGDGTVVPNNGYVLVPKNHYAVENFTQLPAGDKASQTQAIGINNLPLPEIVGFYTDSATSFTHGFLDADGVQYTIDDPAGLPPNVKAPAQNLLGINDSGTAVGFWTDNNGHEHGFVVAINAQTHQPSRFIEVSPASFPGAIATQVSGINDRQQICGFWTDSGNNNHGFFGQVGERLTTFNVNIGGMVATGTTPFGCNNHGEVVGSFTDKGGAVHGFTYAEGRFRQFDATGSSQAAAFGVSGTLINGVNDAGDIVGFFSDGTKVNGFARYDGGT